MTNKHKRNEIIWIVFLGIQPLIDISGLYLNRLPSLIRGGFLLFAVIYLFKHKQARIYLSIIGCYGFIHLALVYFLKQPVVFQSELIYLIKTIYFPIVLLFANRFPKSNIHLNVILFNQVLINGVMLIAGLTQTGKRTYEMLAKQGHTGWFFSGNELSVILMIGLAAILLKLLTDTNKKQNRWLLLLLVIHLFTMLTIGTKVSLFSIFLLLGVATLLTFKQPSNKKLGAIFLTLIFCSYLILPNTPAGHNTQRLTTEAQTEETTHEDNNQVINTVLSGRSAFLLNSIKQYQDAPFSLKMFGLGYGGLYETEPKLVEMDGFDLFFGFGLLGMIILIYPLIVLVIAIIPQLNRKLNKRKLLLLTAFFLTIGSAFTAGHVLSAPAVSIYLILLIVMFERQFDNPKKLLVITTMYPSKKTPAFGIFIKNHVEELRKHGVCVDVLAIKNYKMDRFNVITKYMIWLIKFNFILMFKAGHYHVIHAHYLFPSGWLGQIIKRIYRPRLIVTAHGGDLDKMPKKHKRIAKKITQIVETADHIIVVGEGLKRVLNKKLKQIDNKLTVLNMGVNRTIFKPGSKAKAKTNLKLASDKIIILFVGNLIKAKGLEELVTACESLAEHEPIECHLVGANKEPHFLRNLLKSTRMDIYRHPATDQDQIADWLRAADIFVLPSHIEGFGLAALEAMACHTPVIGTTVGGLAYLLADGAGLTVPPHDSTALANAIQELTQNQQLRQELIKNGEVKANKYDQAKVITKLRQLYDNKELT